MSSSRCCLRRQPASRCASSSNNYVLLYYEENDLFLSAEGILKLISIVLSIILCVVYLTSGRCEPGVAAAPVLVGSAASSALVVATVLVILVGARVLYLPRNAPHIYLLLDITACSSCGVLTLVTGVLHLALCSYYITLHGPLSLCVSALVTGSAYLTYSGVMRARDAARASHTPSDTTRAHPEQDV